MVGTLGWIFLAAVAAPSGPRFVSAQAYAHHLQAQWAELEGDGATARENVALARLYDEGSTVLARAEARWVHLRPGAAFEPPPRSDPVVQMWQAAAEGRWDRVRRGLARRSGRGPPDRHDVELVAELAGAGHRAEAAELARRWAAPGRALPGAWRSFLDVDGWRAWADVDPRPAVQSAALDARWRAGEEVEAAALARLEVHPGSVRRIEEAIRWAGAFDVDLARDLAARWRELAPVAKDERARALLAAGWPRLAARHAQSPALRVEVDLAAGRWARAGARWTPDMPAALGRRLAQTLAAHGRRASALAVLDDLEEDATAFVARARLLGTEPRRLRAFLADRTPRPGRWGAWARLGAEMPETWSAAEKVQAAWSARPEGPPSPELVEAWLRIRPRDPEGLAWMAVLRGGAWLDRARSRQPLDPRVLEAELRWTRKPGRWIDWALRLHPHDERLSAAAGEVLGLRASRAESDAQ